MFETVKLMSQYMTPAWLAEALVAHYFPDLKPGDVVADPTCGDGAFLAALPSGVRRIGVEIDPVLAGRAARIAGAEIQNADIADAALPSLDAVVGNPPFATALIDVVLTRIHAVLVEGGRAGFVLPAYVFQTPSRVIRYNADWGLETDHLPRTAFPGLSKPLVFAQFTKSAERHLVGFAFYVEAAEIARLESAYQETLTRARGSVWSRVVAQAVRALGGEADLASVYRLIEGRRPTPTAHWKPKVRQVLQSEYTRVGRGRYGFPSQHPAGLRSSSVALAPALSC